MNEPTKNQQPDRRLVFALGASVFAFLAILTMRYFVMQEEQAAKIAKEEDVLIEQRLMSRRIAQLEADNKAARQALEDKLKALTDGQKTGPGKWTAAPFAIDSVLGSVVELICIDNVDRDVIYTGSGTVVDRAGVIVTNQHNLKSTDGSVIRYCGVGFTTDLEQSPKIEFVAASAAVHKTADLAILQIIERLDGTALPAEFPSLSLKESFANAKALGLGDVIYIGGYPSLGADTFTFTQGVVSGRVGAELIKTSALIDSGASGGAAFDSTGVYVGVPTAAAKGEIGGSLGYLISAEVVSTFLDDFYALRAEMPSESGPVEPAPK